MVRHRTCNSKYAVNISLILTNPSIGELRKLGILIGKMPDIQRGRSLRTHLTGNTGRLVTVIGPGFLITKNLIILGGALGVNFLVQNRLLTDIGENREIVVQAVTTRPETFEALLIGMVIASNHNADHKAMLNKGLNKITMNVSSNRKSGSIAERSAISLGRGILDNLIDINRYTVAAKILRALKTSVRTGNTEVRLKNFNVTSTSSCILFIKLLHLKSHAELIDSSRGNRTVIDGPKISRNKGRDITRKSTYMSIKSTRFRRSTLINANHIIRHFIKSPNLKRKSRQTRTFAKSSNRIIRTTRHRDGHIRAFLRSRQRGSEVVVELGGLEGHAAFDNIGDIVGAIGTCKGSVIHGNIERVGKIFITKPLVHNECIRPKGQRVNRKIGDTSRDAHVIGNRANRPAAGRGRHLGDGILGGGNPSGLCILTHKLTPMLPYDTVGHKIKIGVQIKIIHHRSEQSLQAGNHRGLQLKSIAGKNLIHIEGDNVSDVETEFNTMVTPKSATSNIKVSRIKSKSCIFIARQVNTSSL